MPSSMLPSFTPESCITPYLGLKGYQLISKFYGEQRAKRSQVPLINHIREGVWLMDHLGFEVSSIEAFCIHPLIQANADLAENLENLLPLTLVKPQEGFVSSAVLPYALEYRYTANAGLLTGFLARGYIDPSPLKAVNDMLVADKVQNYKDFVGYHQATHARSRELTAYFECWLTTLGVNSPMCRSFDDLADKLKALYE